MHISALGWCPTCGDLRHVENTRQLRAGSGPFFDHWRRRMRAAFGVFEPAEPPAQLEREQ